MRLQDFTLCLGMTCAAFMALSGCASRVVKRLAPPPNPFAYQKTSPLCKVGSLNTTLDGAMSVDMTTGNDEGHCALSVSKGGGGSYLSFGVEPIPEHGKAFLYNYNGRTYINYTAFAGYEGSDQFGVMLIPPRDQPRRHLAVKVVVHSVPVVAATPVSVKGSVPVEASKNKAAKPVRHTRRTVHHVRRTTR